MAILGAVGSEVALTAAFTNPAGVAADPSTITFKTVSPQTQTATVYTYGQSGNVTRLGTGSYQCVITCTEAGRWQYDARGSGGITCRTYGTFEITGDPLFP